MRKPVQAKKSVRRVSLLGMVKDFIQFRNDALQMKVPLQHLNRFGVSLAQVMEDLPIVTENIKDRHWQGFILSGDSWYPVHALVEIEHGVCKGGIQYRIDYKDGNSESGIMLSYKWAHCTADDTPNYFWTDEIHDPNEMPELEETQAE